MKRGRPKRWSFDRPFFLIPIRLRAKQQIEFPDQEKKSLRDAESPQANPGRHRKIVYGSASSRDRDRV
jgi:hypothetical protein